MDQKQIRSLLQVLQQFQADLQQYSPGDLLAEVSQQIESPLEDIIQALVGADIAFQLAVRKAA